MRPSAAATLGFLCLVPLWSAGLAGQDVGSGSVPAVVYGDKAPYSVVLDHVTGAIRLENPRGETVEQWTADARGRARLAPLAAVPPDRPVAVRIENANPLLYTYGVRTETVRQAATQSCSRVGDGLAKGAVLATMGAMDGAVPAGEALLGALTKSGPPGSFWGPSLGSTVAAELPLEAAALEDAVLRAAPDVEAYLGLMEPLVATAFTLDDSLRLVARLADGQPAGPLLDDLRALVTRALPGIRGPSDVPGIVRTSMSDYGPSVGRMMGAAKAIDEEGFTGAWATRAKTLAGRLEAVSPERVTQASLALQDALHRIDLTRENVTQTFVTGPDANYRRITIDLVPSATYPEIPRFKGGVDVFTEPRNSILCSVSVGFAFMDQPAEFTDQGGTVGRSRGQEDLRAAPSLWVHLGVPELPFLQAALGVGIGVLRAPDFYMGASLDLLRPIMLNAGWVFQRTRRLPDGLAVGGPFSPAFTQVEDFPRRYGGDFFFGVSLRR